MAESPRRLDLRLTISAAAPYRDIAVELATKFAEYAGASKAAAVAVAHDVSKTVAAALAATGSPHASVELVLSADDAGGVTVTATPLPD